MVYVNPVKLTEKYRIYDLYILLYSIKSATKHHI